MKIKKFNEMKNYEVECLACGAKNQIHFCISKDDKDVIIDHRGRKISANGDVKSKVKNLDEYEFWMCECHGKCGDEMADQDVKLTLDDGTVIIGAIKVWYYIAKNV